MRTKRTNDPQAQGSYRGQQNQNGRNSGSYSRENYGVGNASHQNWEESFDDEGGNYPVEGNRYPNRDENQNGNYGRSYENRNTRSDYDRPEQYKQNEYSRNSEFRDEDQYENQHNRNGNGHTSSFGTGRQESYDYTGNGGRQDVNREHGQYETEHRNYGRGNDVSNNRGNRYSESNNQSWPAEERGYETSNWDGSRNGNRFETRGERPYRNGRTSDREDLSTSGRERSRGYSSRGSRNSEY